MCLLYSLHYLVQVPTVDSASVPMRPMAPIPALLMIHFPKEQQWLVWLPLSSLNSIGTTGIPNHNNMESPLTGQGQELPPETGSLELKELIHYIDIL